MRLTGQCSGVQSEVRGGHHHRASLRRPRPRDRDWDLRGECSVFGEYSESELRTIVVITGRQRRTTAVQPQGEMSLVC